jgi:bifunctional enzyme CysN/CysC
VRELVESDEFIEVFVDTPIDECIRRDPKGLYAKARTGTIHNFTGIDATYERLVAPEMILHTFQQPVEALTDRMIGYLQGVDYLA